MPDLYSTRLHEATVAAIRGMIDEQRKNCGEGQAETMRDYGRFVGYIQALHDVIDRAEEVRQSVMEGK